MTEWRRISPPCRRRKRGVRGVLTHKGTHKVRRFLRPISGARIALPQTELEFRLHGKGSDQDQQGRRSRSVASERRRTVYQERMTAESFDTWLEGRQVAWRAKHVTEKSEGTYKGRPALGSCP